LLIKYSFYLTQKGDKNNNNTQYRKEKKKGRQILGTILYCKYEAALINNDRTPSIAKILKFEANY